MSTFPRPPIAIILEQLRPLVEAAQAKSQANKAA